MQTVKLFVYKIKKLGNQNLIKTTQIDLSILLEQALRKSLD